MCVCRRKKIQVQCQTSWEARAGGNLSTLITTVSLIKLNRSNWLRHDCSIKIWFVYPAILRNFFTLFFHLTFVMEILENVDIFISKRCNCIVEIIWRICRQPVRSKRKVWNFILNSKFCYAKIFHKTWKLFTWTRTLKPVTLTLLKKKVRWKPRKISTLQQMLNLFML